MIPGITTKLSESTVASAATITVKSDFVKLTGNTTIATIIGQFGGGFSGIVFIWPSDNPVLTTTTGNIQTAVTMPQNKVSYLIFSKALNKWVPSISA